MAALREFIDQLLQSYAVFASSEADRPSACLCLVVDHWERIREEHGYSGLVKLLEALQARLETEADVELVTCVLNERCILALVPQCSLKTAEKQAGKLFASIARDNFVVGKETMALSTSLCFVEFDHRFTSADELLLHLVKSAEQVSRAGGNRVQGLRPNVSVGQASDSDRQMLGLLMESLRRNAVRVLFQPLMATAAEPSRSFQVFPRLVASDGSLIPAARFLPAAREGRMVAVLDRWMIQKTVDLLLKDYYLQPIRLFLAQGSSLLADPDRRDWLHRLLEKHRAVSGKLVLDFAIDDAMAHLSGFLRLMKLFAEFGVELCLSQIDEHSKWDLLTGELRVPYIKIAPGFVKRLSQDTELESRFVEMSAPVREKGTRVIMPMIEDATVAAVMWRTGADYMQGYMIEKEVEKLDLGD